MRISFWVCGLVSVASSAAFADAPRFSGGKINLPPVIDGEISAGEWEGATSASGSYFSTGDAATGFPMNVKLAYDEKYVYFCALLGDEQPSLIRSQEYRKNVFPGEDDRVSLILNPFGLSGASHEFTFNARTANHIKVPGGRANKVEWVGEMDSQGKVTDQGWQVEARIPWTVFRLPEKAGPVDVRFSVERVNPRIGRKIWQQHLGGGKQEERNIWEAVVIPKITPARTLKLLPYTYGGFQQDGKPIQNSGLDLKIPLTSGLDFIGTVNPDFRNIENDVLNLDFSYFERLADESRPFFLEGQDFFDRANSVFRSQRINNIDFGTKVIGEINDRTKLGALAVQDFGKESATVLSLSSDITERTSVYAGFAHLDNDALDSLSGYGIVRTRFGKGLAGTRVSQHHDSVVGSGNDSSVDVGYEDRDFGVYLDYDRREKNFRPRLGFAVDNDYQGASLDFWLDRQITAGPVSNWGVSTNLNYYSRISGPMYRRGTNVEGWVNLRNGIGISTTAGLKKIFGFDDEYVSGSIRFPWNDSRRSYGLSHLSGKISGKSYKDYSVNSSYQFNSRFRTSLVARFVEHFSKQTQWIGTASFDMGGNQSLSTRFVRRDNNYNTYFSYRRSGGRGAEYFVILGDPNALRFRTSLVLKAVFPVEIRF